MTDLSQPAVVTQHGDERHSYVDWPAIIAGVALASAISLVLLTFGAALGLSVTNLRPNEGMPAFWVAVAAALWLLWVQVSSFMAGGYLTGRLRRRLHDATEHEVDVRDGAHGILVWAGALVLGAFLAVGGLGAATNTVGSAVGTATIAASNAAEGDASVDLNSYFSDLLLRSETPLQSDSARDETSRIFASVEDDGSIADADRSYLATVVARETNLSADEAAARVDEVAARFDAARAEAVEAAETARKTGILAAFLAAAAFLVSGAGAYWAASMGGRHRDDGTVLDTFFRRF